MKHTTVATLLLVCILSTPDARTQDLYDRYGAYLWVNLNSYNADFRALPGIPNCCPRFTEGGGEGISAGLLYETHLTPGVHAGLRLGFTSFGGRFETDEPVTVSVNGTATPGVFRHVIDATLSTVEFIPHLLFKPFKKLSLFAGLSGALPLAASFEQSESIVQPKNVGVYENGEASRNIASGDIPNAAGFLAALALGGRYEFPLNSTKTVWGGLEIAYTAGFTDVGPDVSWKINALRIGISILRRTGDGQATDAPLDGVSPSRAVLGRRSRQTSSTPLHQIVRDRVATHQLRPLLPYVFFEHGEAKLLPRYRSMQPEEAVRFTIDDLHRQATLPIYYHLLNVVGRRMTQHPRARITLVGCNSNENEEKANLSLSMQRAQAVRNYLRRTWKIDTSRMEVAARNLPSDPSYPTDADGIEENRRVEIHSDTWEILAPIETADTAVQMYPEMLELKTDSERSARDWRIIFIHRRDTVTLAAGSGVTPQRVPVRVDEFDPSRISGGAPVWLTLVETDEDGTLHRRDIGRLSVEARSREYGEHEIVANYIVQRFHLILFEFDSPKLTAYHRRVIDIIKSRIPEAARVAITGYTDRMGVEANNLRLSENRARSVEASIAGYSTLARGMGETTMFPNDLPEGRFYNRTVEIIVETPLEE